MPQGIDDHAARLVQYRPGLDILARQVLAELVAHLGPDAMTAPEADGAVAVVPLAAGGPDSRVGAESDVRGANCACSRPSCAAVASRSASADRARACAACVDRRTRRTKKRQQRSDGRKD
ncbi:hypothetical protein TNCT6_74950 [Streptomyces sp. 6-11-2]|nr:hypothetical protein TNCT6_74950 [Streptomyces sp. 6-11-2]